ncbi:MAG: hypothetical protein V9G29_03820 [Burkholderiaceae bacterium]
MPHEVVAHAQEAGRLDRDAARGWSRGPDDRDVDLVPQRFATADDGFEHHLPAGARAINTARRDQEDLHAVRN